MIGRHLAYCIYIARHKWFVLLACLRTGAGLWRGIVHDASKVLPDEWGPYARTFYDANGTSRYEPDVDFDGAWLRHQRRNRHHWQWWVLREDSGKVEPQRMPDVFVSEMVADWIGAGRATGNPDTSGWYERNRTNMLLHRETRQLVERLLDEICTQ